MFDSAYYNRNKQIIGYFQSLLMYVGVFHSSPSKMCGDLSINTSKKTILSSFLGLPPNINLCYRPFVLK